MKISVIIPLYNVEKYIEECLHSILEQSSCVDIQAIIVDDGSQDDSGATCAGVRKEASNYI